MRIAVDLRALQLGSEYRGIGAYIVNLLRRFPTSDDANEWIFLRYEGDDPAASIDPSLSGSEEIVVPRLQVDSKLDAVRSHLTHAFVNDFGDLADRNVDVFWQPDFLQGTPDLTESRVVLTMYDVIPLVMPDAYLPGARARWTQTSGLMASVGQLIAGGAWRHKYKRCVAETGRADQVLSISEHTSRDLVRILGMDRSHISTIPLGSPDELAGDERSGAVAAVDGGDFLLFVGGVDHRRRVDELVVAFDRLRERGNDLDLVLVGRDLEELHDVHHSATIAALRASPYRDRIHILGYVDETTKHWLFANAFAFVFPSLYEGFGLPLLEAMVNRCPVVSYRNSSLVEVGGDAAILLDPGGADSIRGAVETLMAAPERRRVLIEAGIAQAARYSWDRCAAQTYEVLTTQP